MQIMNRKLQSFREVERPEYRVSSFASPDITLGENRPLAPALFLHSRVESGRVAEGRKAAL